MESIEKRCDTHVRGHRHESLAVELQTAKVSLSAKGYVQLNPSWNTPADATSILAEYQDLPFDRNDPAASRYRRFGRFVWTGTSLVRRPHTTFNQSREQNPRVGGTERWFAPVSSRFAASDSLSLLVAGISSILPSNCWRVDTHLIKTIPEGTATAAPTPEGRHFDGHHYVAQVLIERKAVDGGLTRLYRNKRDDRPLLETVLSEQFCGVLVDDRKLWHEVSPISQRPGASVNGSRSVLLLDFNPV